MRIVRKGDPTYNDDRRIANARFDYHPDSIYYCGNPDDVKRALHDARSGGLHVRIRSGAHQHEGMCSANNVLMIDLSEIHQISFSSDQKTAWIGAGTKLGYLYNELFARKRILPGGGCGDVCVGGLVQGAGWGPYSRALGLTCDRLLDFNMVRADGEIITNAGRDHDLSWAVRGGGGGNFGVVTEFQFSLADVSIPFWQFTVAWENPEWTLKVMEEWCANFPSDKEHKLTSFCRVTTPGGEDAPIIVAGYFLGDEAQVRAYLPRLLPHTYSAGKATFEPVYPKPTGPVHHPEYQPGPPLAALRALGREKPPKDTCDGGFYPHKVSSCFPRSGFSAEAMQTIKKYLEGSKAEPEARRYLSLHCMGGAIARPPGDDWSCFPFRNKPFILQYQTWWANEKDKPLGERCLAWIKNFRETMKPFTEGAFINFPDKDLVPNPDTPDGRKALLKYYYADNLDRLIGIKQNYDPKNFFNFEMGIPTS
ncbi:MAG: FAD-dependent oxidoreductase [Actinomycetota bacterium]